MKVKSREQTKTVCLSLKRYKNKAVTQPFSNKHTKNYRVFHAFWGILKQHISASSNFFKLLKKDLERSWSADFTCQISWYCDNFWSNHMALKSVCDFRVPVIFSQNFLMTQNLITKNLLSLATEHIFIHFKALIM